MAKPVLLSQSIKNNTLKYIISTIALLLFLFLSVSLATGTENPDPSSDYVVESTKSTESEKTKKTPASRYSDQDIHPPAIPSFMELGGEAVPLHDEDVRERLDREILVNTYWHSKTLHMMKLSHKFFPVIEPILAQHGVPDDFKYLAVAESGLLNETSPAGARGPWQFMKAAAKQYNLEVATEVDERYHLEKATHAAARYLKDAKASLGSWALAAAAYNAGNSAIKNQISKQGVDNYYDLYLTTETGRYVFRILAIKEIHSNPTNYGFFLDQEDMYKMPITTEVTVGSIPNIPQFAKKYGTTYKQVKVLNPWLRSNTLSARKSGKKYTVKLPL